MLNDVLCLAQAVLREGVGSLSVRYAFPATSLGFCWLSLIVFAFLYLAFMPTISIVCFLLLAFALRCFALRCFALVCLFVCLLAGGSSVVCCVGHFCGGDFVFAHAWPVVQTD